MAKHRSKSTSFWRDGYISSISPEAKLLFDYCLSSPDSNLCGIYQCPLKIIEADTGIDEGKLTTLFAMFEGDGKIRYHEGWIAIKNRIKHQKTDNIQINTGINKELKNVPSMLLEWVMNGSSMTHGKGHKSISKSIGIDIGIGIDKKARPKNAEEIQKYLDELGEKRFTGQDVWDHYATIGWVYGKDKKPIKDWQAAVRTWRKIRNNNDGDDVRKKNKELLKNAGIE